MTFRSYLRWEGVVAIAVGLALLVLGTMAGHQGAVDALISGAITVAGTGIFMAVRHGVRFRKPATWFTVKPLATAKPGVAIRSKRALLAGIAAEAAVTVALTFGLSYLTRYWLTYVDFGVWAIAIGVIKAGPSIVTITRQEAARGTTYLVARRPLRGIVALATEHSGSAGPMAAAR